jgi:hypothetical protein
MPPTAHHDHRPRRTRPHRRTRRPTPGQRTARQALRRETPSTVALLTDHADFHAMRGRTGFAFPDHDRYLRAVAGLLRALAARGTHVSVVRFHPDQYATYCADTGQDPDRPPTRARYVAEVAATGAAVPYAGQGVDHLITQLDLAAERLASAERAGRVLARSTVADTAYARAAQALGRLLTAAGPGDHHLVCSVPLDGHPDVAVLHARRDPDGTLHLPDAEAHQVCLLLAAGLATTTPGGVVLRTDGQPERVRGWALRDGWLHPLTATQVFAAYCTDPDTGDPVPPEPGVAYLAGTPLPPPEPPG